MVMGSMIKLLATGIALATLAGCGASPAAPTTVLRSTKAASATTAKQAPAAQPAVKQPTVTTTPSTSQPAPAAPASSEGSLKLSLKVTGNAPVASLAVKVFEQADPTVAQDLPLTLSNGAASWSQEEVPAGRYTFQVKALGADGAVLGSGNTEAVVKAGEATEVSLELRANLVSTADTTPTQPQGAVLDLNIEIL